MCEKGLPNDLSFFLENIKAKKIIFIDKINNVFSIESYILIFHLYKKLCDVNLNWNRLYA